MSAILQLANGDFDLSSKALVVVSSPDEELAQRIANDLGLWLGEWYLNIDEGVDWVTVLQTTNPDLPTLAQYLTKIILSIPGAASVESVPLSIDRPTRTIVSGNIVVHSQSGATIEGQLGSPFVVTKPGTL